jgi:twitching motility protein PilT
MIVEEWIDKARVLGASDLHLETNTPLVVRVRGELQTAGAVVPGDRVVKVVDRKPQ